MRFPSPLKKGEVFGLLGPNGAGKTTLISMLVTTKMPTSGHATVNGYDISSDPDDVRRSIGIVFQDPSLDEELTAYENLELHAAMYGVDVLRFLLIGQSSMPIVQSIVILAAFMVTTTLASVYLFRKIES